MSEDLDREPSGSQISSEPGRSRFVGAVKHSVVIAGHRTSVSLERVFWDALGEIAAAEGVSRAALAAEVDAGRGKANLSSALRVFVLERVRPLPNPPH